MTFDERVEAYSKAFPKYPKMIADKGWMIGVWNIGNNYKGSGYHGSYPPSYLKRVMSLFPDCERVLHLFSGSLDSTVRGTRVDINPALKPDVCGDAESLSTLVPQNHYDLILADPPYTGEDAAKYGVPLVNRNKVVKECWKVLKPGGFLCWMDMVLPMYSKKEWKRVGEIAISRSTNHRVRAVFIFQKVANETL
jgi:hypothetical protein